MSGNNLQKQKLGTPPIDQMLVEGQPMSRIADSYRRWLLALQNKINIITPSLVNLITGGTTAGILSTDGSGNISSSTLTTLLDSNFGSTQGSILYRGASAWLELIPGISGQVLQTQGAGANPIWATASGGGNAINVTTESSTGYTLVLGDIPAASSYRGWVGMNNAAANTLNIPLNSAVNFPLGADLFVANQGAGQTTIAGATGVTLIGPTISAAGQYSLGRAVQIATNTWWISGNIPFTSGTTAVTWNPSDKSANITLSNGNLTATMSGSSAWSLARATVSHSSGKYYFEIHVTTSASGNFQIHGVANSTAPTSNYVGSDVNGWGYYGDNGTIVHNATQTGAYSTYTAGDTVGIAIDISSGNLWFAKNNVWQGGGNPVTGTSPLFTSVTGTLFPALSLNSNGDVITGNFAASNFVYTAPSGFNPW